MHCITAASPYIGSRIYDLLIVHLLLEQAVRKQRERGDNTFGCTFHPVRKYKGALRLVSLALAVPYSRTNKRPLIHTHRANTIQNAFSSLTLSLLVSLCLLATPAAAFGAGDIPSDEGLNGHVWRHGDIATAVLLVLPISFETKYKFTKLETMTVYFGNWLRDYSQVVDVSLLKTGVSESLLRAVVGCFPLNNYHL